MFENLYINSGTVLIPTADDAFVFAEYPAKYFSVAGSMRGEDLTLQRTVHIFIRDCAAADIPAGSKFRLADGQELDIAVSVHLFDHFNQVDEGWKLEVVK